MRTKRLQHYLSLISLLHMLLLACGTALMIEIFERVPDVTKLVLDVGGLLCIVGFLVYLYSVTFNGTTKRRK